MVAVSEIPNGQLSEEYRWKKGEAVKKNSTVDEQPIEEEYIVHLKFNESSSS